MQARYFPSQTLNGILHAMETSPDIPSNFVTGRLRLRKPTREDAATIYAVYTSDADIPRFMSWKAHRSVAQTESYVETCLTEWVSGTGYPFIIELPSATPRLIGMIHMHAFPRRMGFGYVIGRQFWNNGYTSEALSCLVEWSLNQPTIYRASAFCDVENTASSRVMEKAGMSYEGTLRKYFVHPNISNEPRDCLMYARVK